MGYTKRNKRCIPKEGMPHDRKACQKKREEKMHTRRRYATRPQSVSKEEEEKENIAHTKNITREREII